LYPRAKHKNGSLVTPNVKDGGTPNRIVPANNTKSTKISCKKGKDMYLGKGCALDIPPTSSGI
jgi:hypothetical protein